MAIVDQNIITEGLRGKLGKRLVFRKRRDGRTIVCTRPDYRDHKWTEDQQAHHSRFKQASAYARAASKTIPLYAEFAKGTVKNAYNLALSDWFHAPVIHEVERLEGRIRVHASDNVLVTKVVVTLLDEQGQTLEQGEAVLIKDAGWEYPTGTQGNVTAEAWDLAGNVTKYES